MTATTHATIPTRRQRLTRSWVIAAASAAIAFPLGLIVAYGDAGVSASTTNSTAGSPVAPTSDGGAGPTSPSQPTLLVPGRPDGRWVPSTELSVPSTAPGSAVR